MAPLRQCLQRRCDPAGEANCPCDGYERRPVPQNAERLRTKISIIENNLREKDYTFDYSKQPSKAMFKYRKAFMRNDGDRYDEFMSRVAEGTEQLHTGTLTPMR